MAGLTSDGFTKKSLTEIQTEIFDALEAELGPISRDPATAIGQLVGVFAKPLSDLWELMDIIYNTQTVSGSEGVSLDNIVQLIGLTRNGATRSNVVAACLGDEGTVIADDSIVSVSSTQERFFSTAAVTISATNVLKGTITINTGSSGTYTVLINAVAHSITIASTTPELVAASLAAKINADSSVMDATDNLDGTITLLSTDKESGFPVSVFAGDMDLSEFGSPVPFQSDLFGPVEAPQDTLTVIETPISNWDSVTNPLSAVLGRELENDGELRVRREGSLRRLGAASVDAIQARILDEVDEVTDCAVFENSSDVTVDSRAPHSIECVVAGGTDQDVGDKIWELKAGGIQTVTTAPVGSQVLVSVTDSQGGLQSIYFSRPAIVNVYAVITLTLYAEETFPIDGNSQVQNAFVEYGNENTPLGKDLIIQRFFEPIYSVAGIEDAVIEWAAVPDGDPAPVYPTGYSSANIPIGSVSNAVFDTSRVTVNS